MYAQLNALIRCLKFFKSLRGLVSNIGIPVGIHSYILSIFSLISLQDSGNISPTDINENQRLTIMLYQILFNPKEIQ